MQTPLALFVVLFLAASADAATPLRDGDIIFHTSRSAQSAAIQRATHSPYSHMGVVLYRDGKPFVFEAIATVRYTPLANWISARRWRALRRPAAQAGAEAGGARETARGREVL